MKNYFEIYGTPAASIRGKMTADKAVNKSENYDAGAKDQITMQSFTYDIMYVVGKKFLISLSEP